MRRYPLEALQALTRSRETGLRMSHGEIAAAIGDITPSGVQAWGQAGIPDYRAEKAAVALGFDPYNVWPEMLDDQIADSSKVCEECGEGFVPNNKRQRFCSSNCRTKAWHRKSYAARPDVRERRRKSRAAYYAVSAEYERKRERARYWANPEAGRQRARDARARMKEAG